MRIQDILSMVRDYLGLGIVILAIALVAVVVGYWGIYKKLCGGKRKFDVKQLFWWIMFLFYLFVVLSVTLFRPAAFRDGQIISFFYSYKDAWISGSQTAWRNIILNILMFVPLGFWLPLGRQRFRVFWKTYLLGAGLTVGIEFLQLILSLGVCEVADVFNNTLGTMIGYGFYKIVEYVVLLCRKKNRKLSYVIISQLPLLLSVGMFTMIFVAYQKQELGNLPVECISAYGKDAFQIMSEEEYSKDNGNALVYQTNILTVEETEEFARNFFENMGTALDESRNDIYQETAVYWAEDNYSIWINYKGGTYDVTDYDTTFPEEGEKLSQVTDASKEEILEALFQYGIEVPEETSYSYESDIGYSFEVERLEENGILYDGILTCDYYDNGKFSNIRNGIRAFEVYKDFEIISEQEAYEQILKGEFVGVSKEAATIEVGQVSLGYMLDTKGFYQPVYNFDVRVDGEEQWIQIPAIGG